MNDPQVWTLIGVMGALFFAVLRTNHTVVKAIDERLGGRIDGVDRRLGAVEDRLGAVEHRLGAVEDRLGAVEHRQGALEGRFDALETRLTDEVSRLDTKIDERADRLTEVMNARFADVDHRLSSLEDDMGLVKAHLIGQRSA